MDSLFAEFDPEEQQRAVASGLEYARNVKATTQNSMSYTLKQEEQIRKNRIEWHKKFTLSFACFIFFFPSVDRDAYVPLSTEGNQC